MILVTHTRTNTYIDPDSTKRVPAGTEGQNAAVNHIKVKINYLSKLHFDLDSLLMVTGSVSETHDSHAVILATQVDKETH